MRGLGADGMGLPCRQDIRRECSGQRQCSVARRSRQRRRDEIRVTHRQERLRGAIGGRTGGRPCVTDGVVVAFRAARRADHAPGCPSYTPPVPFTSARLRLVARLALVAMLVVALWPSFVRAHGHGGPTAWMEVCTAQGMTWVPVSAAPGQVDVGAIDADPQARQHAALDHCPWCVLGHSPVAPGPACAVLPAPPALAVAPPALFLHGPRTLHAWRSPPSRGPPLAS